MARLFHCLARESAGLLDARADRMATFLKGFYKRHVNLSRFKPTVKDMEGFGSGADPWASLRGADEVHLFPKFWELDAKTRDFVFAHELGHWVSSKVSYSTVLRIAQDHGVDLWDTSALPFGQFNGEEAFAEVFAVYHLNPAELLKRYPVWGKIVGAVVDEVP